MGILIFFQYKYSFHANTLKFLEYLSKAKSHKVKQNFSKFYIKQNIKYTPVILFFFLRSVS